MKLSYSCTEFNSGKCDFKLVGMNENATLMEMEM